MYENTPKTQYNQRAVHNLKSHLACRYIKICVLIRHILLMDSDKNNKCLSFGNLGILSIVVIVVVCRLNHNKDCLRKEWLCGTYRRAGLSSKKKVLKYSRVKQIDSIITKLGTHLGLIKAFKSLCFFLRYCININYQYFISRGPIRGTAGPKNHDY